MNRRTWLILLTVVAAAAEAAEADSGSEHQQADAEVADSRHVVRVEHHRHSGVQDAECGGDRRGGTGRHVAASATA